MSNKDDESFEDAVRALTMKFYGNVRFHPSAPDGINEKGFSAVHAAGGLIEVARTLLVYETPARLVVHELAFRSAVEIATASTGGDGT